MPENLNLLETADGFHTLLHNHLNETFHSRHGAMKESMHVFIENGLKSALESKDSVRIFEMGFGTGLNAMLTFLNTPKEKSIVYHSIDAFPIPLEKVFKLNHTKLIGGDLARFIYDEIHGIDWDLDYELLPNMNFKKINADITECELSGRYDVIYFDAFGPRVQPEMWEFDVLQKMYNILVDEGFLITYSANGEFRRTLAKIGYEVESLPGPPGKREMTKAVKISR